MRRGQKAPTRFPTPPKSAEKVPEGELAGFWAVTVRANWRIVFRFEDGHAVDVDYLDYH